MDLGISGRRAAVAAASRGLGFATASALAGEGVRVAVCSRDSAAIDEAASKIGHDAVPITADVSTANGARAFVDAASEALDGVDILVTNAGGPPPGDFSSTRVDQYLAAIELNCLSVIAMCDAAVPEMQRQGWGRVVAITSIAVRQPIPQLILSNTARAGATGFLKTLAREVAGDGVTVNSLQPGIHDTERVRQLGTDASRHPGGDDRATRGLRRARRVRVLRARPLPDRHRDPCRRRRIRWSVVSTTAASAKGARRPAEQRILTVPNLISVARLACVPLFLWLLLARDDEIAAALLLGLLGATDWVDGWIARHFDQGSEIGKVLDPTADRILLLCAGVALLINGSLPLWVGVVVLARELVISVAVLVLAAAGARRMDVRWAGKAGTLALMFALPGFLLADAVSEIRTPLLVVTWVFTIGGLVLSYYAAIAYIPQARAALREARTSRDERMAA